MATDTKPVGERELDTRQAARELDTSHTLDARGRATLIRCAWGTVILVAALLALRASGLTDGLSQRQFSWLVGASFPLLGVAIALSVRGIPR